MTLLKQIRNSEDTIDSELHDFQSLKDFYLELNKEKAFEIKSVSINDVDVKVSKMFWGLWNNEIRKTINTQLADTPYTL